MKQLTHLQLEMGPGGWLRARWRREKGPEATVFVRFRAPRTKRDAWAIVGLQALKGQELHTAFLDEVPRYMIARAFNAADGLQDDLTKALHEDVPNDLDAWFPRAYRDTPRLKLERPSGHRLDESFYRDVATAYKQAVIAGLPPLRTLAEDSGIPQGTIARWVAKTREPELAFLPPAKSGETSV